MGIPQNLKRLREKSELSQPELARRSGVSQQLISQLENGRNLTTKKLPQIARALGVPVHEIDSAFSPAPVKDAQTELAQIYDRLAGHPDWQHFLLEQARQLQSRVLSSEAPQSPPGKVSK